MGGDEFAVLARETSEIDLNSFIRRFEEKLEEFNRRNEYPFSLSVSIGKVHCEPDNLSSVDELIEKADKKMYEIKMSKQRSSKQVHVS